MAGSIRTQEQDLVRRTTGGEALSADSIDGIAFAPGLANATHASNERRLHTRVISPVLKAIATDPDSMAALKDLTPLIQGRLDQRHSLVRFSGEGPNFEIAAGQSVFYPPYDYAKPGPTDGEFVNVWANPMDGTFGVDVSGYKYDGARGGSAAVGLGIEPSRDGIVSVRPFVTFDWSWWINGLFLSASARGHLGCFVAADGGPVVSNSQDLPVFWSDSYGSDSGIDVVRIPYQEVTFVAEAHRPYQLWYWVNVFGDQSGDLHALGLGGWSWSLAHISACMRFVVVDLR